MHTRQAAHRHCLHLLWLSCFFFAASAFAQSDSPWLKAIGLEALQSPGVRISVPLAPASETKHGPSSKPAASPSGRLLELANQLRDVRYRRGGRSPANGFDCSGFVSYVFRNGIGASLPNTSAAQFHSGISLARDELQAGDLVFFRTRGKQVSHVGIYLGDGEFIHAPSRGKRVSVSHLAAPYWAHRYAGAKRPEALAKAQEREVLKPAGLNRQRLAIKASISSASLGTVRDITSGSPSVTTTSSSIRMPMPR